MKRICSLVLLILSLNLASQEVVNIEHRSFKVNNLGQYLILDEEGLDLYDSKGDIISHHSEELLGRISSMDRVSSLRTLTFYADIPAFQVLDNTLSPHSELYDLNRKDFQNISTVCTSSNNTYWGMDPIASELIRFDENYRVLTRSGNLSVLLGRMPKVSCMFESGNMIYAADELGILVFDQFGTYKKTISHKNVIDMDIEDDLLVMTDGSMLIKYDLIDHSGQEIGLDGYEKVVAVDIQDGWIYLGNGSEIIRLPADR